MVTKPPRLIFRSCSGRFLKRASSQMHFEVRFCRVKHAHHRRAAKYNPNTRNSLVAARTSFSALSNSC